MDEQEYRGHWWLPDQYDERVGGVATYSSTAGIHIELFDSLVSDEEGMMGSIQHGRIHGLSTEGDAIVLLGCNQTKYTMEGRVSTAKYTADFLLEGHFFFRNNISFDSIRISFPLLEEWTEMIESRATFPSDILSAGDKLELEVEVPQTKRVWVDGEKIELSSHFKQKPNTYRGGSIDGHIEFRIEPRRSAVPLSEYLRHIKILGDFVTFSVDRPVNPRFVNGFLETGINKTKVGIFYSLQDIPDPPETVPSASMAFQLSDIDNEFDEIIRNWYKMSNNIKSVIDLYFGTQYNKGLYPDNAFLMLIQAFESFHREKYEGTYEPSEKYEEILDDLRMFINGDLGSMYDSPRSFTGSGASVDVSTLNNLNEKHNIDSDLINKLTGGVLEHANEYSLRKRLREVIDEYEPLLSDLPHNIINKQHKIIETRNQITHQTVDPSPVVAAGSELVELNWGMEQLLAICLLTELGIPEEHIKERLERKYSQHSIW